VTAVAALITTFDTGLASVASLEVCTLKFVFVYVAAAGFVMPAIATVPEALLASVQPEGRVIVTTLPEVEPVAPAPQPEKLPPKVTAGEAGMPLQVPGNVTVTASPALSEPLAVAVKPAVHVATALAFVRVPAKLIAVGVVAAEITTFDAGLESAKSELV
jgi:hypothetical protein